MSPVVHVLPVNDLIEHLDDSSEGDCICGPDVEAVPDNEGGFGWVITHHSLDGRERNE